MANGENSGNGNGVCRSLGAVHEIGARDKSFDHFCKNMFLQFRNAFKESFMDCSQIMSHEQSGKSRHGFKQSYCREVPRCEIFMEYELRFGLDLGQMANFPAFIASKSFDL